MATREKIRRQLYSVWDLLDKDVKKELDLYIPTTIYLQDPLVAANDPQYGFSELEVRWEPGLRDGPTSARFAVVDYNADTGALAPPAHWDSDKRKFTYKGSSLNGDRAHEFQFHQVNVWAHLQDALIFFEEGAGMGRRIPWGFDGNRLIVVPHAGYGQNAYYDRQSKSLQFYYYEHEGEKVFTCLSADIIHHEFGHAVLDGVRPFLQETVSTETAAFHEFVGDISAILLLMRNNDFRRKLAKANSGGLAGAMTLESIAEQFGKTVEGREYLRSATNKETMATVQGDPSAHFVSQVLTGAMYDMLLAFAKNYQDRGESAGDAFWHAINRMQRVVFQPLDLLPPADVTFRDYAFAVLRNEELSNPTDPDDYQTLMREIFLRRGILQLEDIGELIKPRRLYDHFKVDVFHRIESITQSRASAYRFLDDNRRVLCIPSNQDFIVADLYEVNKYSEVAHRLPRQYVLVYLWREEVELRGSQYGRLDGQLVAMLCGGTLVFDERGNNLSRFQKHGSHLDPSPRNQDAAKIAAAQGQARLAQFKADIAHNVQLGLLGIGQLGAPGLVSSRIAPFVTHNVNGATCFELSAHLSLSEESRIGERSWQISS